MIANIGPCAEIVYQDHQRIGRHSHQGDDDILGGLREVPPRRRL